MGIEAPITGSERIVKVFGHWPSFHDAEVLSLRLARGTQENEGSAAPSMEMVIHAFEMTDEVSPRGTYVLRKHVLVHFRFNDIVDLKLEDFNHQNVLLRLCIFDIREDQLEKIYFEIRMDSSFGLNGGCKCKSVEVVDVKACDEHGVELRGD
jgi:hypothetical protein